MFLQYDKSFLKYELKADSIIFWCSGIDEYDNGVASLLNAFLLDISKEQKVFFHGYRLPNSNALEIIDSEVVLAKAEVLLDPFHTFFYLREAKVNSNYFSCACEATIYYFEQNTEWSDFLATSIITRPIGLIRKGQLSAHFSSTDQGADFWFECNKAYEKKVLDLLKGMSDCGYEIKKASRLLFPYS